MQRYLFVNQFGEGVGVDADSPRRAVELLQELLDRKWGYDPESEISEVNGDLHMIHTRVVWMSYKGEKNEDQQNA